MTEEQRRRLRAIKTFAQLIDFLRDELNWPIDQRHDEEDLTFDWSDDLGLKDEERVGIKEIKQLRPLETGQPWGIFFVDFEKKHLPIVILRRILNALVLKKRASANQAQQAAWQQRDLLFISAYGQENERQLTFAHFSEPTNDFDPSKAKLRVLGWDDDDTNLKLDYVADTLKAKLTWPPDTADLETWRQRWSEAFELRHREVIDTAAGLALRLAELAQRIRNRMLQVLPRESEHGELRKLLKGFQAALIHDLDEGRFADMYAQTITYGLFSAAVSRTVPGAGTAVHQGNVVDMVPVTNPFLREMLSSFLRAGGRRGKLDFDELGIQEVVDLLNDPKTHMEAVLRDFGNRTRGEDPVIHFYEEFLKAYDRKLKVQRGVFYTPQPVVSYIVRSVHELLQTEFGLVDGLADTTTWGEMLNKHPGLKLPPLTDTPGETRTISPDEPFVQILDPATGTATFVVEVIEVIYRTLVAKWRQQRLSEAQQRAAWNDYVPRHLLPRLHAFELMMAPYAIAHMKIGLKLAETGYRFGAHERARIYLTNALEPWVAQLPLIGFDALAHEAAAVNEIKRHKRFTVVIGNPPYSNFGMLNKNPFILGLLEDYKRGLDDKKINLDDDFIKFVRLSEAQLSTAGVGIHGMITNNAYLDGLTHRRMRQRIRHLFPVVKLVNLHGSSKKKEKAPDGTPDENVFDITVGVAIGLLCRAPGAKATGVAYADSWGSRDIKTKQLIGEGPPMRWFTLSPQPENFFFVPKEFLGDEAYRLGWSVTDVFGVWQNGIKTDRDDLFLDFDRDALSRRMRQFYAPKLEPQFREQYKVVASSSYDVEARRLATQFADKNIRRCLYRPMDVRWLYYEPNLTSRPAEKVMKHMLGGPNLGLIATRQTQEQWDVLSTNNLCGHKSCAAYDINSLFPLYLYEHSLSFDLDSKSSGSTDSLTKRPNFNAAFLKSVAANLQLTQRGEHGLPAGLTPEDIFRYSYAVFHSPGYRSRYAEFLKIDFPRLPLTGNLELFRALALLGGELVALHLLESPKLAQPMTEFIGGSNPVVEKISWSRDAVSVDKAQTNSFQGVPQEVWSFHIGGYQVCEKWLKDRKGRTLSQDDIAHYQKIVVALSETIRLMVEIDRVIDAYGGWPGAFQTAATA